MIDVNINAAVLLFVICYVILSFPILWSIMLFLFVSYLQETVEVVALFIITAASTLSSIMLFPMVCFLYEIVVYLRRCTSLLLLPAMCNHMNSNHEIFIHPVAFHLHCWLTSHLCFKLIRLFRFNPILRC